MTIAVVTGAGRGIGRAAALLLADRGADVALLARTGEEIGRVAREVRARGRRAVAIRCDVASSASVEAARDAALMDLGVPDVVVNNAGLVRRALLADLSEADWDAVIGVNLKGTFLVTRAFLPRMRERGEGRIVAVSSISGTLGTPRLSAYCAAKWGVIGLVKSLAEELRGTGLQAMAVAPGSVDTKLLDGSGFAPTMQPADVARAVVFAALDAPPAMNGSVLEMFGP